MDQASSTAIEYFADIYEYLDRTFPKVNAEVKMQCASQMTLAAAIDFLTVEVGGHVSTEGRVGIRVHMTTEPNEQY